MAQFFFVSFKFKKNLLIRQHFFVFSLFLSNKNEDDFSYKLKSNYDFDEKKI